MTPAFSIKSFNIATVEALLRIPDPDQQSIQMMLPTLERQGRRLSDLIKDLLLLASLEQDSAAFKFQPCCLNDLVTDLAEEFLELAIASNINLTSQVPPFEIYTLGHELQLYRLVSNLIANAIQYTPAGGSVIICLESHDRIAKILVKDTGIGIPLDQHHRIFDRFYRVDSDRSRKTAGTGLGLAIAQGITQKHQAHLNVDSRVGQGSLFTVEMTITSHSPSQRSNENYEH